MDSEGRATGSHYPPVFNRLEYTGKALAVKLRFPGQQRGRDRGPAGLIPSVFTQFPNPTPLPRITDAVLGFCGFFFFLPQQIINSALKHLFYGSVDQKSDTGLNGLKSRR